MKIFSTSPNWRRPALVIAAVTVLGMPVARAQSIPIFNASFENPQIQPGTMSFNGIPGWSAFSQTPPAIAGVANLPASAFSPPTDGTQIGYMKGNQHITQIVGVTNQLNTVYLLGIDCYALQSKQPANSGLEVRIMSTFEGPLIGNCSPSGSSNHMTLAFNPDSVGPQNITIEIDSVGDNSFVFFDHVTLTAVCFTCVSQGFGAFDLAQRQIVRQGVICASAVFPCITALEFIDSHGVLLTQAHLNLRPGETGFLDFVNPPQTGNQPPPSGDRPQPMVVIPRWFLTQGSANFSLEVSDETDLRTRLFINWGDGSVSKSGNLSSGLVSLTRGDTGRLKVYCDGSVRVEGTVRFASCQADLAFHDTNGRVLRQSHLNLAPGTAGFLDLTFEETRSADRRTVVIPMLTVAGGPAVGGFAVLDSETGITITQSYPAAVQSVAR
jgi:hypothetical protein